MVKRVRDIERGGGRGVEGKGKGGRDGDRKGRKRGEEEMQQEKEKMGENVKSIRRDAVGRENRRIGERKH